MTDNLDILYEDDSILVINKAPCSHSVMQENSRENSVALLISKERPECISASANTDDCGLINRLDYETSGILIAAKNRSAWSLMRKMLLSEKISKKYLAVLDGHFIGEQSFESFLGSPYRRAGKIRVYRRKPGAKVRALFAKTTLRLIYYNEVKDFSLVEVSVESAKRHQIRAHSAAMGHPLSGDSLYGSKRSISSLFSSSINSIPIPSFFLHASEVSFALPSTSRIIRISAPLPALFMQLSSRLEA